METWEQIINDPEFIALPEIDRNKVRQGYFRENIASDPEFQALPPENKQKVLSGFLAEEKKTQPKPPLYPEGLLRGTISQIGKFFGRKGISPLPQQKVEPTPPSVSDLLPSDEGLRGISPAGQPSLLPRLKAGVGGFMRSAIPTAGIKGDIERLLTQMKLEGYPEEKIAEMRAKLPKEIPYPSEKEHPVAAMVGKGAGTLTQLMGVGTAIRPIGVELGKALVMKGAPTIARFVAPATQTALTFATCEAIRGVVDEKPASEIAKQSSKSFLIGGGLGMGGGIVNIVGRLATAGAMGPVSVLINQGKIRKEDLPAVGVNSAVFMLFTAMNAPKVSKALKQQARANLFKSSANFVKAKNPTLDQATINKEANIFTQGISNLSQKAEVRNLEQFTAAIQKILPQVSARAQIPYGEVFSPAVNNAIATIHSNISNTYKTAVVPPAREVGKGAVAEKDKVYLSIRGEGIGRTSSKAWLSKGLLLEDRLDSLTPSELKIYENIYRLHEQGKISRFETGLREEILTDKVIKSHGLQDKYKAPSTYREVAPKTKQPPVAKASEVKPAVAKKEDWQKPLKEYLAETDKLEREREMLEDYVEEHYMKGEPIGETAKALGITENEVDEIAHDIAGGAEDEVADIDYYSPAETHKARVEGMVEKGLTPYEGWKKDYPDLVKQLPAEPKVETIPKEIRFKTEEAEKVALRKKLGRPLTADEAGTIGLKWLEKKKITYAGRAIKRYSEKEPPKLPTVEPVKGIPTKLEPLAKIAREFAKSGKGVDEFVEAQPTYYHGTPSKFKKFMTPQEMPDEIAQEVLGMPSKTFGIYFTTSKKLAKEFGDNIVESKLELKKSLNLKGVKTFEELVSKLPIDIKEGYNKNTLRNMKLDSHFGDDYFTSDIYRALEMLVDRFGLLPKLKTQGYDSIIFNDRENAVKGETTIVFDISQIKTKAQLTGIYSQATKEVAPVGKIVKAKPKVVKEPTTYRGLVLKRGGINPDKVRGIYNLKEDFWQFGIAGTLRKSSGYGLDELAQEMVSNNELFVPEDRNPGEYLLEQLQQKAILSINDEGYKTDAEYDRDYKKFLEEEAHNENDKRQIEAIRRNREKALEGEVAKERGKTINDAVGKQKEIARETEKVRKGLTTKYGFGEIQRELPLGGQTDIFDYTKKKKVIKQYTAGMGGAGRIVSGEPEGVRPVLPGKKEKIKFPTTGGRKLGGIYKEHLGPELITKKLRKWEGLFKYPPTPNGKIAVRKLSNLQTLAHETGHFLDLLLVRFPISRTGTIREELIALTKTLRPFEERYKEGISEKTGKPTKHLDSYSAYRRSRPELFADYISAYATNPDLAKKIAPQFTASIEGYIASGSNTGETIKYIVDKIREFDEEFNPLIDYVDSLRKIPEFRKEVEASFEKGNALQMFYRHKIGDKLWGLLSGKLDKIGQARFIKGFFEKGGVPDPVFFATKERLRLIHGQVAKLQEELIEPLRAFTPEDKLFLTKSLQNFRINKEDTPIKKLTETARQELALWGNEARKLGLLNDKVFWDNVGQYYPYFYSTKEFSDNRVKFGTTTKAVRTNLRSFKHRLTDEEMVLRGLKAHYGTWPSQLKKVEEEMAAMSPSDIKVKAAEIREKMGLIEKNPEYSLYKRMNALIQSVYTTKCLNNLATMPGVVGKTNQEGYLEMPESASLGALSGQWVSRNTANMINQWDAQSDEYAKVLETVTQIWKALKVPYNPAAISRNIVSNFLLQYMIGDVPIWKPIVAVRGIKSFTTKDKVYKLLRDNGLYKQTYAAKEMEVLAGMQGSLSGITEWAVKTFNTPGKVYGAIEDVGKTMIARYTLDNGGTVGQAVDLAQKCLFDYSNTSVITNKLRKFPIPFITFSAKVLPRLVEVAVRKPEKYILMFLLFTVIEEYARQRLKMSKKTLEAVKPSYLKGGQFVNPYILLPGREKNHQLQFIDCSYFVPWGGWTQMQRTAKWIPQPLQVGNPFIMFYNAYVLGFDPFSGREISPKHFTRDEQRAAKNRYFRQGILPDLLGGRATERLIKVYRGEPDYYGREPDWKKEVLRDLTGVNIVLGGEMTTGVSTWKREKIRADIERKRPVRQALINAFKTKDPKVHKRATDLFETLSEEERGIILKAAVREYAKQASGAPTFLGLPQKDRDAYIEYLDSLKKK